MIQRKFYQVIVEILTDKYPPHIHEPKMVLMPDTKNWVALALLSSIGLVSMYAETMLLPAIPDIIRDFHIDYNTSAWILTAYLISGAVVTPIAGKLSDIYGRKKILLAIMIIYTIGVTLGGLSFSISSLIAARIIQGIGLAMFPIAFGIIRSQFPQQKLAFAQGIFIEYFRRWISIRFSNRRNNSSLLWMACHFFFNNTYSYWINCSNNEGNSCE